jgi:hypothetical protein
MIEVLILKVLIKTYKLNSFGKMEEGLIFEIKSMTI